MHESAIAPIAQTDNRTKIASTTSTSLPTPSTEQLKEYLLKVSALYGQSYQEMNATIMCESGWQVDPPHNGISFGIAQFTLPTWKDFGSGDIMNPRSQLETMSGMWSEGLKNRWDCYRMLYPLTIP